MHDGNWSVDPCLKFDFRESENRLAGISNLAKIPLMFNLLNLNASELLKIEILNHSKESKIKFQDQKMVQFKKT